MLNKLKSWLLDDTVYVAFLLVLVGVASFGLGRLSVTLSVSQNATVVQSLGNTPKNPVLNAISATSASSTTNNVTWSAPAPRSEQNYVASKFGTKYHAQSCPGAKQIKATNKIYFATEEEAQAAGYTRAANCSF